MSRARDERRRQAEKEKAEAEAVEARQRRSLTIIGVVVVAAVALLLAGIGVAVWRSNQPVKVDNTPAFITGDGAIVVDKDGVRKDGAKFDKKTSGGVVQDYQDFMCPGCGQVNREIGGPLRTYLKNDGVILKSYPIAILDNGSSGGKYSTRTAAMAYRVAELSPKHYLDFVDLMFSSKVQPEETGAATKGQRSDISDAELEDYAVKAGLTRAQAKKAVDGKYTAFVKSNTDKISSDQTLWRAVNGGQKQFMTPIVRVNGKDLDYTDSDFGAQVAKALGVRQIADGDGSTSK